MALLELTKLNYQPYQQGPQEPHPGGQSVAVRLPPAGLLGVDHGPQPVQPAHCLRRAQESRRPDVGQGSFHI